MDSNATPVFKSHCSELSFATTTFPGGVCDTVGKGGMKAPSIKAPDRKASGKMALI